jgi:hypothetical protein
MALTDEDIRAVQHTVGIRVLRLFKWGELLEPEAAAKLCP